jgi:hypothetical protein
LTVENLWFVPYRMKRLYGSLNSAMMRCSQNPTNPHGIGLRHSCLAAVACVIWGAFSPGANAEMMVAADIMAANAVISGEMAMGGEISSSQSPAASQSGLPLVHDQREVTVLVDTANNSGAGSPSPTNGHNTGLAANVVEDPETSQNSLVSRLSLLGRACLPSPLEDRFFRPPRAS